MLKATAAIEIARLTLVKSTAEFETGLATQAINDLRNVIETISGQSEQLEFAATLAMFSRESQFQTPTEVLPTLSRVRQLAARLGSPDALAGLHLAVARLEAYRGHCVDARRHLEIARTAAAGANRPLLGPAINLVDASLETIAGNLSRATNSAKECFQQSVLNGFGILQAGAVTNLGFLALCQLEISRAQDYLAHALEQTAELSFIRLAALDNLLQLALYEDDLDRCDVLMKQCSDMIARQSVPSRSWYDLAHQVTRCSVLAHVGDWEGVIELTNELDRIVDGRQFRSLRVALLCASARALANVGEFERARGRLTAAIHACPRGAVEPLIVLEAATGACLVQMGDGERGEAHFDRALSASRSLGNRFQEQLILRERAKCRMTPAKLSDASLDAASRDNSERSLVLSDVATILGAGSSIDLLAHRAISLVQGTRLESRLHYRSFFEQEFRPEISIDWRTTAEGRSQIELRGSDRLVILGFDSVESLEEVTLIKSLVDLLRAAVRQETGQNAIAGDLDLWPETSGGSNGEAIFGSPRMAEILRVSIRLAATDLPILITGETGTGKDVFARLVHANSGARRGPFVPFNCSSIARDLTESQLFGHRRGAFTGAVDAQPGVIRSASGGTLFLDEIGDMELSLQPKLLRFIESGEIQTIGDSRPTQVKVRLVAATNANLDELSRTGQFRRDLFFRLGAAQIALPPLRERKDEIPALTASFINRFSRETARPRLRVSDDLIAALLLYDWPGNIRQLANEMHRIVAMAEPGQTLTSADLSPIITDGWTVAPKGRNAGRQLSISLDQPLPHAIEELERAFVDRAMQASGGRVAEAAQLLGISRKGLFLKRRRWGHLDPQDEAGVETTH
ncbi:MAG: sigma-54-dependent Fis family transcriptional regulator [Acidobacteria bacterium]|nr:MAG: sigma-54-dependent Fis family transcriptional regulator [Acidobacteriota bacterium]